MKKKNFNNKLRLSKSTISNLSDVIGGIKDTNTYEPRSIEIICDRTNNCPIRTAICTINCPEKTEICMDPSIRC